MIKTPHINAKKEDFANTVLMPGDPKRAKFIAKNFLENAVLVNDVRGVQGYTGTYKGKKVSVMASGMGVPSMAIYSYELFNFFGVKNIIRVGSAGSYQENVNVRDIVLAKSAVTNSNYISAFCEDKNYKPVCSSDLLESAKNIATKMDLSFHIGEVFTSDIFYEREDLPEEEKALNKWGKAGVLAVEMETAALYLNAQLSNKNALTICTISDSLVTGEAISAEERQNSFSQMIMLALELAISMEK